MASATSSRAPNRLARLATLVPILTTAVAERPVPLLVLRIPEFERIAWREGKRVAQRVARATTRAFVSAAARSLRAGDRLGHDPGSDVFAIVMTSPSREERIPSPIDCRSALERIAASVSLVCDLPIQIGWTMIRRFDAQGTLDREIENALERGAREKERYEFFAAVGHELRTPLTSIRGYLETLLDGEVDPQTARRFLETARREALRLGRLLDGMFEFSLLDLSADALSAQSSDVRQHLSLACEVVAPLAQARGIEVAFDAPAGVLVGLDSDVCVQMFVNLLDNAIKYGRDGGTVRASAVVGEGYARIAFDDDGPGVAPSERESIFGLRIRGSHAARRPGTGIGLAIVKMIVERAGGEIRVTDSPLGGARFDVFIPLKAESAALVS